MALCDMSTGAIISGNVGMAGLLTGSGTYTGTISIANNGVRNGEKYN